jgi:GrpB-like predicted nucleotidyltransferase (UPF0157 family)/quercetin dioxygenase-like cupin family protein
VDILRFDLETAVPVTEHGSRFALSPLIESDGGLRVVVIHMQPGDSIGRHPAAAAQLFAVMHGSAQVAGEDQTREIQAGYAALWEPGEEHEVSTADGLIAVCIEGRFDPKAYAVTREIVVEEHDPQWAAWFEQIRARVWPAVKDVALRVDHIGSTSVPGLAAKPIIDLDVVLAREADVQRGIEALRTEGYQWRGDLGVVGRQAFTNPPDTDLPGHHLYLVVDGSKPYVDHWLLRDMLREDPIARQAYAELKQANAVAAGGDIDYYVAAKAKFVAELLTKGRTERGLPPAEYWDPDLPER